MRSSTATRSLLWVPLLLALAACGGSDDAASGGDDGSSGGETEGDDGWGDWDDEEEPEVESHHGAIEALGISGPDQPWAEMSHEDREWYMVGKVLPIMKELFAEHDADRWGEGYECETCHGENMREVEYAMPPAASYKVPEPGSQAWASMENIFGDTVTFMKDTVTPTMGTLLGEDDYTCFHCHPRAE